jgi:hypothetical protein
MEEISKYYTPTIDEFHIGFEYEWFGVTGYVLNVPVCGWMKNTLKEMSEDIRSPIKSMEYRVKYLDKVDIESLGFRYTEEEYEHFEKGTEDTKYFLDYDKNDHMLYIHNGQDWDDGYTWFEGTIKNKSELKVLLKQLGI